MRIAITGPESTGKSELGYNLSLHYNIPLVPEFARKYLIQLQRPYKQPDLTDIAKGQLLYWNAYKEGQSFISDTEMLTIKIWSEVKYQKCDTYISKAFADQKFDLYLLCYPDISWEPDELREHPSKADRIHLFSLYKEALDRIGFNYKIIKGEGNVRLNSALEIVNLKFENG